MLAALKQLAFMCIIIIIIIIITTTITIITLCKHWKFLIAKSFLVPLLPFFLCIATLFQHLILGLPVLLVPCCLSLPCSTWNNSNLDLWNVLSKGPIPVLSYCIILYCLCLSSNHLSSVSSISIPSCLTLTVYCQLATF
jgi:hypothetical protein